mmetsp:Transcript_22647/g.46448  ORF Transcript_22647/g.46448 Transcript_22647/m.46448 type:complete len:126 (+) Transcript_22647:1785-2162(+)
MRMLTMKDGSKDCRAWSCLETSRNCNHTKRPLYQCRLENIPLRDVPINKSQTMSSLACFPLVLVDRLRESGRSQRDWRMMQRWQKPNILYNNGKYFYRESTVSYVRDDDNPTIYLEWNSVGSSSN